MKGLKYQDYMYYDYCVFHNYFFYSYVRLFIYVNNTFETINIQEVRTIRAIFFSYKRNNFDL